MNAEKILYYAIERTGALLEGHFRLSSGLHSAKYIQCAKIFEEPAVSEFLVRDLSKKIDDGDFDLIVSPAIGGIIFGYELARQLNKRNVFFERKDGVLALRRGFEIKSGSNVIIAEDVLTTGKTVKEIMDILKEKNVNVKAVVSLINRTRPGFEMGVPFFFLLRLNIETYEPEKCPLCKEGIPVIYPGSRDG